MAVSAVSPWRKALLRDLRLPSGVLGPVLLDELRRFASICRWDVIADQLTIIGFVLSLGFRGVFSRMSRGWLLRLVAGGSRMGLLPECSGNGKRIDLKTGPPRQLVAGLVQLSMMAAAKRNGEFIAYLAANGARLSKSQVVGIARLAPANHARLRCDEVEMGAVANPLGLRDSEGAFVDAP